MLVKAAFLSQNRSFLTCPMTVLFGPSSSTTSSEETAAAMLAFQSFGSFMPPCSLKKRRGSLNTTCASSSSTRDWLTSKAFWMFARRALILAATLGLLTSACAVRHTVASFIFTAS